MSLMQKADLTEKSGTLKLAILKLKKKLPLDVEKVLVSNKISFGEKL